MSENNTTTTTSETVEQTIVVDANTTASSSSSSSTDASTTSTATTAPTTSTNEATETTTTSTAPTTSTNGATSTTTAATTATTTSPTNKRKETETPQPKYIETRIRKKAREALDLISNTKQRQASLFNLLGDNYTGPTEQQLSMMFRLFSRNGKTIGADELKAVIRAMGKRPLTRRIDKILYECDENGNGTIEEDEFIRYMQKKAMEKAKILGLLESDDEEEAEEGGDTDEEKEETPKKKAANAKPKSSTKKKAATKKTASTATTTAAAVKAITKQPSFFQPLKKGTSIVHYFTENAGIHTKNNIKLDQYNNPQGLEYDLGVEGAFTEFTVLIGKFYNTQLECINDLKGKGFKIIEVATQKEFIDNLPKSDVALIISNYTNDNTTSQKEFVDAVVNYHKVGKGLFVWNDNEPYTLQGNWVTQELFGVKAIGNEPGKQDLTLGKATDKQHFGSHLITSGIVNLYEGITISSYPTPLPTDKLQVLATSSAGNSIVLVSDNSKLDANCGRVVIDTGFTKLFAQFFSAGTSRYIKNACVWLLSLDHRFALGVDPKGEIAKPKEEPVWQYQHGQWFDYDLQASKVVEEAYQEWLTNPYTDVRSVKSGVFAYQIDFKQNTQTNIQHQNHTTRPVRRVLKQLVIPTLN